MDIWAKWAEHYKAIGIDPERICEDGILNDEKYRRAKKRILFVLRETNDYKAGLRELLKGGPRFPLWHTVNKWAAGILNDFPPYLQIENEAINSALPQVAVINIKKVTGGSKANPDEIGWYAHQDRDLLLEQIKNITPEIIVACGTFDTVLKILNTRTDTGISAKKIVRDANTGALVVRMRHPAMANNVQTYDTLKAILQSEIG